MFYSQTYALYLSVVLYYVPTVCQESITDANAVGIQSREISASVFISLTFSRIVPSLYVLCTNRHDNQNREARPSLTLTEPYHQAKHREYRFQ